MKLIMTENFHIMVDIIDSLACKWWVDAGCCLGIVREKDFLKWDYDIDIGIASEFASLKDSFINRFESFGAKLVKERYYRNKLVTIGFKRLGVKLDLWFYHEEDGFIWHAVYKHGIFYPVVLDARFFTKLKEVKFKGRTCYLPNPPEEYLKVKYGEDWRIPKPDFKYWSPIDHKAIKMDFFVEQ